MANYRGGRINEEVKREVSNIIQNEIKDPRLTAMVSVTDVKVTRDLRYAKVFVSIFGKDDFITEILKMTEKYKIPWEKAER